METRARVRLDHFRHGKTIKEIVRLRGISRNSVRKILRAKDIDDSRYERGNQHFPKLGAFIPKLEEMLKKNETRSRKERFRLTRIYDDLVRLGFEGGYDSVRRFAKHWRLERRSGLNEAFVPLSFAPGEAYQFDWSTEGITLGGVNVDVKVAHFRLAYSRMPFLIAYPRETQEMVFDAHDEAFSFFEGTCCRGIYDNMPTAVDAILTGKDRRFNAKFLKMCSHYLVEPTACSPAAGWEKGQVENQVKNGRDAFFKPRRVADSLADLNAQLREQAIERAKHMSHPDQPDRSVWDVFQEERASLVATHRPFLGCVEKTASVARTCLVRFDRNKYSVEPKAIGRPVQVHAYANRIVIRQNGENVGEHDRCFGRGKAIYNPWHFVPVLARKPGALRNGAPFKELSLPLGVTKIQARLSDLSDGDRQMVDILLAAHEHGLDAVEAACVQAIKEGLRSAAAILNILSRQGASEPPPEIETPEHLKLSVPPIADCARYDLVTQEVYHAAP